MAPKGAVFFALDLPSLIEAVVELQGEKSALAAQVRQNWQEASEAFSACCFQLFHRASLQVSDDKVMLPGVDDS